MIAIIYREDLGFTWPGQIRKNVDTLPEGYTELKTQADYDAILAANQASFDAYVAAKEAEALLAGQAGKFDILRKKWDEMANNLAVTNIALGITAAGKSKEVADAFRNVVYYLNAKTPTEAIAALQAITPIPVYLEQAKIDELVADFSAVVAELWG